MREYGDYTDEQRAAALVKLAANAGNVTRTAAELGVPEATLRSWRDGARSPKARKECALKMRPTAERCDEIAASMLDKIEEKIDTGTLAGTTTAFGIMVDKAAMLRAAAPPDEGEQVIDLSKLSPERLEILNGWLAEADAPPEAVHGRRE